MSIECYSCGKKLNSFNYHYLGNKRYCKKCSGPASEHEQKFGKVFEEEVKTATNKIILTTTMNIEGYKVKQYIDIESVEYIIGTGVISEFGGGVTDFFGRRSGMFENKLQKAKKTALESLKYLAFKRGGNAVIGCDLDYTEFSGNRVGLIINGTVVSIEPIDNKEITN